MSIQKSFYITSLSLAVLLTHSSAVYAGFEWVPQQQQPQQQQQNAADMAVQDAPVTPVTNQALQPAPPAPMEMETPVVTDIDVQVEPAVDDVIIPMPGETREVMTPAPVDTKMKTLTMMPSDRETAAVVTAPAPAPVETEATAMAPQQLNEEEMSIDLPTAAEMEEQEKTNMATAQTSSNAPVNLVPASSNVDTEVDMQTENTVSAQQPMIKPFPIMRPGQNTAPQNMGSIPTQNTAVSADPMQDSQKEDAIGFGTDMPLALALQQIVPNDYAYSFSKDVNPGARVSWNGGKPWDVVLKETLAPHGLNMVMNGNTVVVVQDADQTSMVSDEIIAVEPAAGAAEQPVITEDEMAIYAAPEKKTLKTSRVTISDPGEIPSEQPNISVLEETVSLSTPLEESVDSEEISTAHIGNWRAKKGESLKRVLYNWGAQSNTQIIWEASHDFTLESDVNYEGPLENAYQQLFQAGLGDKKPNFRFVRQNRQSSDMALVIVQDPTIAG